MTKPFEHVLILSDFDGTFAGAGGRIVPENIEAIERFKALGGHFTFSTGRLPSVMAEVLPPEIRLSDELAAPYAPRFVLVHRPDINHPGVRMLQRLCDEQFGGNYYGS